MLNSQQEVHESHQALLKKCNIKQFKDFIEAIREAEAGGLEVQGLTGLHIKL